MADVAQIELLTAPEVLGRIRTATAANGLRYSAFGDLRIGSDDLLRILEAVPPSIASLLDRVYCFVPLTISEPGDFSPAPPGPEAQSRRAVSIAAGYSADLADRASCHRDVELVGAAYTFISSRLMQDRFALAFELFINVGHHLVDSASVPADFRELVLAQDRADVRGETSLDAWEYRRQAQNQGSELESPLIASNRRSRFAADSSAEAESDAPAPSLSPEEATEAFVESALADALAIYMLSLAMDIDYADLRERDYPLLAAPALADRLRSVARRFPPGHGYEFAIRSRRRP